MHKSFITAILLILSLSTYAQELYVQRVVFPEGATTEQKVEMASRLVPSRQQLEWQQLEFTCFLHFGMNTFTNQEWGNGTEDPNTFNPTDLDCEQWVKALKDGGFKMAIITAKHHDGFCLWQTKTTKHSVVSSKWKDGKGDVVKELRDACTKYGLKFGVYLSPWDRNASCYGDSPAYNKFFVAQLTELLTNYGRVDEVWFDGACGEGPNGKKQVYDWDTILKTIHTLQPQAVTSIMGDDVRWVGNEGGVGRETEWSATISIPGAYPEANELKGLGITNMSKDLGSREMLAKVKRAYWYPSEVDVSIRPGWFFHTEQNDKVRSLANLVNIYFSSVGRNSVLLLNIPPDKTGHLYTTDVTRIKELNNYIQQTFAKNLLADMNPFVLKTGESREFNIDSNNVFNTLLIQEDIRKGQHVEQFKVEAHVNGKWIYLTEGTTVGYKRLLRFSDVKADAIRLTMVSTRNEANISNFGLYYAQPLTDTTTPTVINELPTDGWKIISKDANAVKAIDGNLNTTWSVKGLKEIAVDMGKEECIKGFCYAPAQDNNSIGTIFKYKFFTSKDSKHWTEVETIGEFSNIKNNPVPYYVHFQTPISTRYFRLKPIQEIDGEKATKFAEIGILTK